jgi:hypothetical protein
MSNQRKLQSKYFPNIYRAARGGDELLVCVDKIHKRNYFFVGDCCKGEGNMRV